MRIKWGNTQRSARTTLRTQCVYHVNVSPSLLAAISTSSIKHMVTITCHTLRLWGTGVFRTHRSNTPCLSYTSSFYSFYNSASLNPLPLLEYDLCFLAAGLCWSSSFHQKYFSLLHLPIYNLYGVFTPLLWPPAVPYLYFYSTPDRLLYGVWLSTPISSFACKGHIFFVFVSLKWLTRIRGRKDLSWWGECRNE